MDFKLFLPIYPLVDIILLPNPQRYEAVFPKSADKDSLPVVMLMPILSQKPP